RVPGEGELGALSRAELEQRPDRATQKKVEILQSYARRAPTGKAKRLVIRFLVSPVELIGDAAGHVAAMRLVKNRLEATGKGGLSPKPTGVHEELPVGLVFRSVGYRGVPLPGVPFHEGGGVILNDKGRVLDPDSRQPIAGEYTAGWIKRGPSGVIGTNKPDALETVECMIEDLEAGRVLAPPEPDAQAALELLRQRQPRLFTFADWLRLNEIEV